MAQQAALVRTPRYYVETYSLGPGQKREVGPLMAYGVALSSINPLWGLGFVSVSLDNGPFIPISLLPIRQPFQYVTIYNMHPNTSFTVTLVYTLDSEAEIYGQFNYVYAQFNQELTITDTFSATNGGTSMVFYNKGPYYIGTRSIVLVNITGTVSSTNSGYIAQVQVELFNSDALGNTYSDWGLGFIGQQISSTWFAGPSSLLVSLDGSLLQPYVILNFGLSSYAQASLNITIVAR